MNLTALVVWIAKNTSRSQRRAQGEEEKVERDQSEEGKADKEWEKEEEEKKVLTSKTKSQLAREARKEKPPAPLKEPTYPLVPSKKNKEHYFKRFLEIFKRLEIIMPFGEAL